jgi:hypothetical protein
VPSVRLTEEENDYRVPLIALLLSSHGAMI